MNSKEMLVNLFVEANQSTLQQYEITLTANNLNFANVEDGSFGSEGEFNTRVTASTTHPRVTGVGQYTYNRLDINDWLESEGVEDPVVTIVGDVTQASFLAALKSTYNIDLASSEVTGFQHGEGSVFIEMAPASLAWTGQLIVTVIEQAPLLGEVFSNNMLNGFEADERAEPV